MTDDRDLQTVILVPDGTLCFMRPVVKPDDSAPDGQRWIGLEVVWLKYNDEGIWEGIGPLSGHIYRTLSWYTETMAERLVNQAAREEEEHNMRPTRGRFNGRLRAILRRRLGRAG